MEKPKPKSPGRPRKEPPEGAADKVRTLSSEGHSLVGIAQRFKIDMGTFNRWLKDFPKIKEAVDQGRETERYTLHNSLYKAATEGGNCTAAMFLLKARHGYREGEQEDQANRVSINFTLPGAMPLKDFIEIKTEAVGGTSPAIQLERK